MTEDLDEEVVFEVSVWTHCFGDVGCGAPGFKGGERSVAVSRAVFRSDIRHTAIRLAWDGATPWNPIKMRLIKEIKHGSLVISMETDRL